MVLVLSPPTPPRVSVLMPAFNQGAFVPRALGGLFAQTVHDWELVVIDDGSSDGTVSVVAPYLRDPRVRYRRLHHNVGLGAALNHGLAAAAAPFVAYLPADDVWFPAHLASLLSCMGAGVALAHAGVGHRAAGAALQLVQVLHRVTEDRWVERDELESDDLERLFWSRLRARGRFVGTGEVTCEWVDHPAQRHKAILESHDGGLNVFRSRYRVRTPLRFHSSEAGTVDEVDHYRRFRDRPPTPRAPDGLKILLVGELAYNPERVLALEERGHRLYGLWTPDGLGFNTVGPLPFGHVEDLASRDWEAALKRVRPDVIYALLNWRAVPFAHAVLSASRGVPFVWHFKEAPQRCLLRGTWPQLADLCTRSDAQVYSTPEERAWFDAALPGRLDPGRSLVLDGDLPKGDWFTDERRRLLSETDRELHTVVLGRPVGLAPHAVEGLARLGIHTHVYGTGGPRWREWSDDAGRRAPRHLHVHPPVDAENWVGELSAYDGGWLHPVRSDNGGDIRRATWDDLNFPARIPPLVGAGVPLLHVRSAGCTVATQNLIETRGLGVLFEDLDDLRDQLSDAGRRRETVWDARMEFTFDHHVDRLGALFRRAVDAAS